MTSDLLTLTLVRHAKASHQGGGGDMNRPLSSRGHEQVKEARELLCSAASVPGRILCSTAVRARETCLDMLEQCPDGSVCGPVYDDRLYLAAWSGIISVLSEQPDSVRHVTVVGHNMGISDLAGRLLQHRVSLRTFGVVCLNLQCSSWRDLMRSDVTLTSSYRVRM